MPPEAASQMPRVNISYLEMTCKLLRKPTSIPKKFMNIEALHIGMKVRHPAYGVGSVAAINEHTCDVKFEDGNRRTVSPAGSALQPAEATAEVTGLTVPLKRMIDEIAGQVIERTGYENPKESVKLLGVRWSHGTLILKPQNDDLQAKEVPLETFFHKIVMMRNQLRVLEQKINSHDKLTDAEKVEMQQYITRCYGSMTTFNILFREKEDQF